MKTWGVYILAALGFAIYGAATEADRDGSGAIIDAGSVDAFNVEIGDCFDDTAFDEVSSLPGVPCSEPHDNEAYAVFDVTLDSYPDVDTMSELANFSCVERFKDFVGRDYESSSLDVIAMYPSPESWSQNDREVVCAVYDMEAVKLTGSVKGLGL